MADKMLAQAFGAMKIEMKDAAHGNQYAKHHTLTLAYPDLNIPIQPTETVEMLPPAKVEHRQHPPHNMMELALYETNFIITFLVGTVHNGAHQSTEYMRLLLAVEKLQEATGKSTLGVVRVSQEIWETVAYRVRLETEWFGPFQKRPPQDFELSEEEWEQFLSYAQRREWIGVLGHLVHRASAKAYYHARQRIIAVCGAEEAAREENSWRTKWGVKRPMHAADLFLNRIEFVEENCRDGVMPEILLECGHGFRLDAMKTSRINSLVVLSESCETCGVRLLNQEDEQYLAAVDETNEVARFAKMQKVWANLVGSGTELGETREFHSMTIFRVLGAAFESLKAPEWVAPTAICPSSFIEMREVLDHLESIFYDQHRTYERTAEHLLEDLEQEAMGVRINDVMIGERINPPGFDDFLARWLRRTAYFLAYRRCEGHPDARCQGLHWHSNGVRSDGLWYASKEWEKTEGERFEESEHSPFQMKSVMKALEGIEL